MIEETMKKYYEATGNFAPVIMMYGDEDYEKLLEKAIERKKPLTADEIDEFCADKVYDIDLGGEFEDGLKKGFDNK